MLITVLAENSHIRAVGFEGEEIRFHASVQTEPRQTSDYYILVLTQLFTLYGVSGERITGVVLASVNFLRIFFRFSVCVFVAFFLFVGCGD